MEEILLIITAVVGAVLALGAIPRIVSFRLAVSFFNFAAALIGSTLLVLFYEYSASGYYGVYYPDYLFALVGNLLAFFYLKYCTNLFDLNEQTRRLSYVPLIASGLLVLITIHYFLTNNQLSLLSSIHPLLLHLHQLGTDGLNALRPYLTFLFYLSAAGSFFLGLFWSVRKFRTVVELEQARFSVFFLSTMMLTGLGFYCSSILLGFFYAPLMFVFLIPYFWILVCVTLDRHIIFIEIFLQSFITKLTVFSLYFVAYRALMHIEFLHDTVTLNIFFLLLVIFSVSKFDKTVESFYKRTIYRPLVDYGLLFKSFSSAIVSLRDVNLVPNLIVTMFYGAYEVENVSHYEYDDEDNIFYLKNKAGEARRLDFFTAAHPVIEMLKKFSHAVRRGDFDRENGSVRELFEELSAEACMPLSSQDGLFGLIFLGQKMNGTRFNTEDLEMLNLISAQVSVSFNYAKFIKTQQDSFELMAQKNKMDTVIALSSGVNHEINNPLSIISMKCQNFLRKSNNNKFDSVEELVTAAKEVIESCLRNAGRAHMITKRLGNFAKPTKTKLELEELDLKEYIEEAVELIGEKQLTHSEIEISIEVQENLMPIWCDKSHLQQILFNLLINAVHAIREKGKIIVRASAQDEEHVRLEIQDTGAGIKEEALQQIWEPFFTTKRANAEDETGPSGTGLGLALVRRYIENAGGRIEVESEYQVGTKFSIYFRRAQESSIQQRQAS